MVGIGFLVLSGRADLTAFRRQARLSFSWLCNALAATLVIFAFFPATSVSGSAFGFSLGGAGAFVVLILVAGVYVHRKLAEIDNAAAAHRPAIGSASPGRNEERAAEFRAPEMLPSLGVMRYAISGLRNRQLGIVTGDLRKVTFAEAWVNSSNTNMTMSSNYDRSVSGAIRYLGARKDAAGNVVDDLIADELARKVAGHVPVMPGVAVVTGPGELARSNGVKYVIHVAAVQAEYGQGYRQVATVDHCVTNALTAADQIAGDAPRSILFPLLGVGSGRGDRDSTAMVVVAAAVDYLLAHHESRVRTVYFQARTNLTLEAFELAMSGLSAVSRME